ncbi:hypothetical protein LCGC14_1011160 [marine sediment metagenome]|uniref:Uncharacterized protein n=1 Tax=marine sediment metagenome TaxID=412755 RepID=A0A0F9R698_9ZZZZ
MGSKQEMKDWLRGKDGTSYGKRIGAPKPKPEPEPEPKLLVLDSLNASAPTADWNIVYAESGQFSVSPDGTDALLSFGKYDGARVSELAADHDGRGYLTWILGRDFHAGLLDVVRKYTG